MCDRNIHQSPPSTGGPSLQPRHVPPPEIELATFWFTGWCSVHCTTPARAILECFSVYFLQIRTLTSITTWQTSRSENEH